MMNFRNTFIALVQARLSVKLIAAVNRFLIYIRATHPFLRDVKHLLLINKWTAKARFHVKEMCICQCLGRKDASCIKADISKFG